MSKSDSTNWIICAVALKIILIRWLLWFKEVSKQLLALSKQRERERDENEVVYSETSGAPWVKLGPKQGGPGETEEQQATPGG